MENSEEDLILSIFSVNTWTDFDAVVTIISFVFLLPAVISLYYYIYSKCQKQKYKRRRKQILKGNHIIVCGLNYENRIYIDSEISDSNNKIIIIEEDKNNLYIEKYIKENLVVEIGDAANKELLKSLNINNAKHILISVGIDMKNLEIATQVLDIDKNINIFLNIEDRKLRHFHKEDGILDGTSIKMYSYDDIAARELFEEYDIDGNDRSIITSNGPFSIAVVGNTNLAYEVIFQAAIMAQLPNQNIITIYCIDKDSKEFKESLELNFPEIRQIHTLKLKFINLNVNSKSFYEEELWRDNLTNILLCFKEEQKNLNIASNLAEITYIDEIAEETLKINILLAMFNDYNVTNNIKINHMLFRNFNTFGNVKEISNKNIIINEMKDSQAKCINFIYNNASASIDDYSSYTYKYSGIDMSNMNDIESSWIQLSYFKKESNRAVADHIKMKLKYLGLIYKKVNIEFNELYDLNKEVFLANCSQETKLILAKNEHQRWNTFHYLYGYKKMDILSKAERDSQKRILELKKLHQCLIPFEDFKSRKQELVEKGYSLGEFECYDFLINEYIPFIMSKSGYQITRLDEEI